MFVGGELFLEAEQVFFVARLDQCADQGGGGGEAHAMAAAKHTSRWPWAWPPVQNVTR